ncbi:MAG: hypothetical protein O9345_04375 [Burkholderiaceae bacterium]|jgi:hypothetical protein|nr:hypothetical protein [Acidobacteriaceae bacterium]MCZ8098154.1 hypothetical protein [Burkholderiales bacterium]MCZ8337380.1 hypothetical protein [Burkholderiaceae bacterium]
MTKRVLLMVPLISCSVAAAGVQDGDLFGYRLGTRYVATEQTRGYTFGMESVAIVADKPVKSEDFTRVELIVTPKTLTIGNIYGVREFDKEGDAKRFAAQYTDLLNTVHGKNCQPTKG